MVNRPPKQPQLPPTSALENSLQATSMHWFEYPVTAYPHHTDYAGVVWHGTYVAWMEEARVECLRSIGVDYANLVAMGCEMPVVEFSIRYHQPVLMGMSAIVKTRMAEMTGVRINWDYQIQSVDGQMLFATAQVSLVAVDREKGKILRQLPPPVKEALAKLAAG
ncbi:acyl-CoA thioesterase [Leptothermofonsia sichuanensis E412]|jgi:acyl-CoA thioester hydrolase|uniref:acyl-CoA thioesterase n=1 Tax=Leptothermofonsia sichuanensis TaxID=2917832 RepID=UPI001CA7A6FC|nr:thioesterase family protein [Leptothermofonsia sichuanensis]QZZ21333.1 acyl-CoA thioesterase [Leptothermofonsia sichuanensis E412]